MSSRKRVVRFDLYTRIVLTIIAISTGLICLKIGGLDWGKGLRKVAGYKINPEWRSDVQLVQVVGIGSLPEKFQHPLPVSVRNTVDVDVQNTVDVEVQNTLPMRVNVENTPGVEVQNTVDVEVQNMVDVNVQR